MTTGENSTDDIIGKELLGQFRIVKRIGRGGMGEVFKAEQPAMDRLVAIKILHQKLAARQDLVSRFRREARAMSRLTHPNTVRVFLYGQLEETEQLYIVMEYLDGIDLARLVRRDGPMEVGRATKVMVQVLGALEEAHSVGIVHRDLKPENILLTTQGGLPDFPKVLDFGLAKIRDAKPRPGSLILTQEGMVFGTPEFMSPEQARGETLDATSDVYSVALIFYELITGRLPFPRSKPMEYISHHIYTQPIPVSERVPDLDLPKSLDPIVGKALEKECVKRYQSAAEFAQALKVFLPSSAQSVTGRSMPRRELRDEDSSEAMLSSDSGAPASSEPRSGRGLVVGLLAVIAVLLAVLIWLVASLSERPSMVVPIGGQASTIGAPESVPPATAPVQPKAP